MKHIMNLYHALEKQEKLHHNDIFNYAVPDAWNTYGYSNKRNLRSGEILVNPYSFYLYTLHNILFDHKDKLKKAVPLFDEKASKRTWLKKANIYSLMIRSATAWDHDRDDRLPKDNLYHLNDNGTFLKSILLIPHLKRMGINTILLHQPFALCKTHKNCTYANKESITNFTKLDENLKDSLVPELSVEEQCLAFMETCHLYGIRIILEFCPGKIARNNDYVLEHPEWFYWIKKEDVPTYHAPVCPSLPQNTIPHTYTLKDLYRSEDVIQHISLFQYAPTSHKTLLEYEQEDNLTIAPMFSDQINANLAIDEDSTVFNYFEDRSSHFPKNSISKAHAPYLLQDTIRQDLHPGKTIRQPLWDMINACISWDISNFHIDGIYIEKTYLLPEKLQKEMAKNAHKQNPHIAMIAEDTIIENSNAWIHKGYDAISGNSGYEESNIWNFNFHTFAYRLKDNPCPMFAASEFYDAKRIASLEHGKTLSIMLHIMNQFLPNGIPMVMNGFECFDVQPMQLSEYGDQKYLMSLPKSDFRYHRQAYIDEYYFDYCSPDLNTLPSLLEKCHQIRSTYIDAITNIDSCVPVWFDSPKDFGIGYSFILENRALMVICNTNVANSCDLHIHTENLYAELPFHVDSIYQIFSTQDPYLHDVEQDEFRNLPLHFAPGEVKFIEFKTN